MGQHRAFDGIAAAFQIQKIGTGQRGDAKTLVMLGHDKLFSRQPVQTFAQGRQADGIVLRQGR